MERLNSRLEKAECETSELENRANYIACFKIINILHKLNR